MSSGCLARRGRDSGGGGGTPARQRRGPRPRLRLKRSHDDILGFVPAHVRPRRWTGPCRECPAWTAWGLRLRLARADGPMGELGALCADRPARTGHTSRAASRPLRPGRRSTRRCGGTGGRKRPGGGGMGRQSAHPCSPGY